MKEMYIGINASMRVRLCVHLHTHIHIYGCTLISYEKADYKQGSWNRCLVRSSPMLTPSVSSI